MSPQQFDQEKNLFYCRLFFSYAACTLSNGRSSVFQVYYLDYRVINNSVIWIHCTFTGQIQRTTYIRRVKKKENGTNVKIILQNLNKSVLTLLG